MDKKNEKFEEQDHPLKNTDHAFVQVGKNGEPVMPHTAGEENRSGEAETEPTPVIYDKP